MAFSQRSLIIASVIAGFAIIGARPVHASCIPGFDYAAFGKTSVDFGGQSSCDSWSSSTGTYATTQANTGGNLGTDGTSSGAITVHGTASSVYGNLVYGAGGSSSSVSINGHPTTGASSAQTSNLVLPSVSLPTLGSNLGAVAGGSPAANNTYTTVAGNVTLSPGTYVIDTLTANVTVSSGPVIVYIKSGFNPSGITNTTGVPGNLLFMVGPAVATIDLTNIGGYYAVYAPDTTIGLHGNQDIYGAIVGKSLAITGTPAIHYDRALASASAGSFSCGTPELSRAEPIVATVSGSTVVIQGSLVSPSGTAPTVALPADLATFVFPFIAGHVRARVASTISTAASTFASGTILFDAATAIPTVNAAGCGASAYTGSCRTVFTTTQAPTNGVSRFPPKILVQDGNADTLGPLLAPSLAHAQWVTLVDRLLAGAPNGSGGYVAKLGGVDRSTVAVVGASAYAGGTRPTITYVGATDGMLHAICASVDSPHGCDVLGRELWAFIPRVQLPFVRLNQTRIDGSPRATDMFGDFTGSGQRSFRTILTFQTGSGDATTAGQTPAIYALDVTNPQSPIPIWELTVPTPAARGALELGVGETLATATEVINNVQTPVVFAETNNGGTGGSGVVVTAIRADTGAQLWQFGQLYGAARTSGHAAVPSTGVPGGAVAIDRTGQGYTTDLVFADLYGSLWVVDPLTGTSRYGTGVPLFRFANDYLPIGAVPAIYSSAGQLFAAFASGGYADPSDSTWGTATQELVAVRLSPTVRPPPSLTEASGAPDVPIAIPLGANESGFAQVLVIGTHLFVTTDTTDVNAAGYGRSGAATGSVQDFDLAAGHAVMTVAVMSGASSLANIGTTLYSSSGQTQQQLSTSASATPGASVASQDTLHAVTKLWLRTQ